MAAFFIDLSQNEYSPGYVLSGTLTCIFDGPEKIEDIEINVRGEEHTKWSGNTDQDNSDIFKTKNPEEVALQYSGYNKLLSRKVRMPGVDFQAGQYNYRFSFQLPRDIPGSYVSTNNNDNNSVIYYVKISIKRASQNAPTVVVKNFEVKAPIDLKKFAHKSRSVEKNENGLLKLRACLDKNIFLRGEEVELKITISNPVKIRMEKISAEVGTVIEATTLNPSKITRSYYTPLGKQDVICPVDNISDEQYSFRLKIPENADVPNFSGCQLFKLSSVIKVIAVLPTYKDVTVTLPIIVGHVISSSIASEDAGDTFFYDDILFEPLLDYQLRHETYVVQDNNVPKDFESNHSSTEVPETSTCVIQTSTGGPTPTDCPTSPLLYDGIKPQSDVITTQPLLQKSSTNFDAKSLDVDNSKTETTPLVTSFHDTDPSTNSCLPNKCSVATPTYEPDLHIVSTNLLIGSSPPFPSTNHDVVGPPIGACDEGATLNHGTGWGDSSEHEVCCACCGDDDCDCDCDCDCDECDCDCGDCDCGDSGDCCDCDDCVIL